MSLVRQNQKGFTIIELMIATAALSVILLVAAVTISAIGKTYIKGINQSHIQNNIRSIGDTITQQIQLDLTGDTGPARTAGAPGTAEAYCIGSTRYSFVRGVQKGTNAGQSQHVLWRDNAPSGGCTPVSLNSNLSGGSELMEANSRLVSFGIVSVDGTGRQPFNVIIKVAYGDNDLLCSQSVLPNTCNNPNATMAGPADYAQSDLACKPSSGSQFCATASFNTVIGQRLQ